MHNYICQCQNIIMSSKIIRWNTLLISNYHIVYNMHIVQKLNKHIKKTQKKPNWPSLYVSHIMYIWYLFTLLNCQVYVKMIVLSYLSTMVIATSPQSKVEDASTYHVAQHYVAMSCYGHLQKVSINISWTLAQTLFLMSSSHLQGQMSIILFSSNVNNA